MNYIGITGHRGSGKTSVGYLLGNILDCLKGDYSKEDIKKLNLKKYKENKAKVPEDFWSDFTTFTNSSISACEISGGENGMFFINISPHEYIIVLKAKSIILL